MKIEAEVHNSLYSFTSVESSKCGVGGTGCSNTELLPPSAQDNQRESIGRPERQLTLPGCGSNKSSPQNQNNKALSDVHTAPLTSVFDCEHFQFIDEEEADENGADAETEEKQVAALVYTNGTTTACNGGTSPVNGFSLKDELEVSSLHSERDDQNMNNKSAGSEAVVAGRGPPVKRQVSFDDATTGGKGLKSLLKKQDRKVVSKRRVTFDEAVTLYSDENEDVRYLALTTGPDILCAECYMFEPPIEYQDVPPFEPPAEYRDDTEELTDAPPAEDNTDETKPSENNDLKNSISCEQGPDQTTVVEENINGQPVPPTEVLVENNVSKEEIVDNSSKGKEVSDSDSNQMHLESTKESDKLFERFLEAEREFAIDEELNNVFHELDSGFVNDGRNGALDDNFFRKLITLLTSAEGEAPLEDSDFLSSTKFANSVDYNGQEAEDDESSQGHSRTLSEADSDCSISSQDTIIVRLGEEDNEIDHTNQNYKSSKGYKITELDAESPSEKRTGEEPQICDEVFNGKPEEILADEKPQPFPRESLVMKNIQMYQAAIRGDKNSEESLSRQSSGEQSVNSANSGNSQDHPQDADDSTSSDSRSGEVEEEIRLDDIGYDEEDADDYDEESFRGMARGNSKIRRIIKKNALQCTLFKGIEAKRRQQPGAKYPRPKSPLLSQESLVEKLKWLTTVDDQKDPNDCPMNFHSKPPDVILSTGTIPLNNSSESDIHKQMAMSYQQQQQFYQMQRFAMAANNKGGYYVQHENYHPSLPRPRMAGSGHPPQMSTHNVAYQQAHMVAHQGAPPVQWSEQRNMTVPRNFRDWRVIQRVVNRNGDGTPRSPSVPSDYVRCANGKPVSYPPTAPLDVSRTAQTPTRGNKDELEQFVEQDSKRIEKLRKRYSMAEEEDDPSFGFARRPSVRGVQTRMEPNMSDTSSQGYGAGKGDLYLFEESGHPGFHGRPASYSAEPVRVWNRDPNWRPENGPQSQQIFGSGRSQAPMHIHRASVALTELPGNATIPYVHRKPNPDPRYHSYVESMYGSTRTLPTPAKGWDPRTCHNVPNTSAHPMASGPSSKMLQVPLHPVLTKDERGVPEGASSSPKLSSDSLYNSPVPDSGGPHKDGMIYYSLNV